MDDSNTSPSASSSSLSDTSSMSPVAAPIAHPLPNYSASTSSSTDSSSSTSSSPALSHTVSSHLILSQHVNSSSTTSQPPGGTGNGAISQCPFTVLPSSDTNLSNVRPIWAYINALNNLHSILSIYNKQNSLASSTAAVSSHPPPLYAAAVSNSSWSNTSTPHPASASSLHSFAGPAAVGTLQTTVPVQDDTVSSQSWDFSVIPDYSPPSFSCPFLQSTSTTPSDTSQSCPFCFPFPPFALASSSSSSSSATSQLGPFPPTLPLPPMRSTARNDVLCSQRHGRVSDTAGSDTSGRVSSLAQRMWSLGKAGRRYLSGRKDGAAPEEEQEMEGAEEVGDIIGRNESKRQKGKGKREGREEEVEELDSTALCQENVDVAVYLAGTIDEATVRDMLMVESSGHAMCVKVGQAQLLLHPNYGDGCLNKFQNSVVSVLPLSTFVQNSTRHSGKRLFPCAGPPGGRFPTTPTDTLEGSCSIASSDLRFPSFRVTQSMLDGATTRLRVKRRDGGPLPTDLALDAVRRISEIGRRHHEVTEQEKLKRRRRGQGEERAQQGGFAGKEGEKRARHYEGVAVDICGAREIWGCGVFVHTGSPLLLGQCQQRRDWDVVEIVEDNVKYWGGGVPPSWGEVKRKSLCLSGILNNMSMVVCGTRDDKTKGQDRTNPQVTPAADDEKRNVSAVGEELVLEYNHVCGRGDAVFDRWEVGRFMDGGATCLMRWPDLTRDVVEKDTSVKDEPETSATSLVEKSSVLSPRSLGQGGGDGDGGVGGGGRVLLIGPVLAPLFREEGRMMQGRYPDEMIIEENPWDRYHVGTFAKLLFLMLMFDVSKDFYVVVFFAFLLHVHGAFDPIVDWLRMASHSQAMELTLSELRQRVEAEQHMERQRKDQEELLASRKKKAEEDKRHAAEKKKEEEAKKLLADDGDSEMEPNAVGEVAQEHRHRSEDDGEEGTGRKRGRSLARSSGTESRIRSFSPSRGGGETGGESEAKEQKTEGGRSEDGRGGRNSGAQGEEELDWYSKAFYQSVVMLVLSLLPWWNPHPRFLR
eukprot:GHVQ01017875.1.p1 GENE.GHVQ01017875.1~~GHVQ01017875.1.p1  ORF type:complete len:1037 (+),score=225.03 GHVQ01017875.1:125-3235(+)